MPSSSATVRGQRCEVRITRDLTDNYAVEVMPPAMPNQQKSHHPVAPLFIYKLKADNWQAAAWTVLQGLKDQGKIEDFQSEAVPPKPVRKTAAAAEEAEEAE